MNNRTIFGILSFVFLIGSTCNARRWRRMVGGEDAEIEEFPHLVSLRYLGLHFCGGSIISDRHVLTAAHCIVDLDPLDDITVHSGTSRSDKLGIVHEIEAVHSHPDWKISENNGYLNDVAVITLKDRIVFDKNQKKISLPSCNVHYNEVAYLPGWGRTKSWSDARAKQLQKLKLNLITNEKCQSLMNHKILPNHVCAISRNGTGMCFGDSGGALALKGEVIAISTFLNDRKCGDGIPAGFTNIFYFKDFIQSVMKK